MKHIEGTNCYNITVDGRVINKRTGRELKQQNDNGGRLAVRIKVNDKNKKCFIHRLVAEAYIPNPNDKPQVDHIDGDNSNNNMCNLRWCTNEENTAFRDEQRNSGEDRVSKRVVYDGVVFSSIRVLSRHLAEIRGSKPETIRKAIKAIRHGAIKLYGKECKLFT